MFCHLHHQCLNWTSACHFPTQPRCLPRSIIAPPRGMVGCCWSSFVGCLEGWQFQRGLASNCSWWLIFLLILWQILYPGVLYTHSPFDLQCAGVRWPCLSCFPAVQGSRHAKQLLFFMIGAPCRSLWPVQLVLHRQRHPSVPQLQRGQWLGLPC